MHKGEEQHGWLVWSPPLSCLFLFLFFSFLFSGALCPTNHLSFSPHFLLSPRLHSSLISSLPPPPLLSSVITSSVQRDFSIYADVGEEDDGKRDNTEERQRRREEQALHILFVR